MSILLHAAFLILLYAHIWFIISIVKKRNDVADIAWGLGYVLLAFYLSFRAELTVFNLCIFFLVFLWGLRLAVHIFIRNRHKSEDARYKAWRNQWGKWVYLRSYLQVFILQSILLLIIASPVYFAALYPHSSFGYLQIFAIALWILGFFFESIGDYQLAQFLSDPKNAGKIMTKGLWKYTRHPNYFGEITMWWALGIYVLSAPYGYLALISPLTITTLLLFVSGIPMTEKRYTGNPDFEAYKSQTSPLIPLPPRQSHD